MKHYISTARLQTYKNILKLKDDDEVLRAYYWNKVLGGAIYPAMQTLEVTLRNSLNEAIKNHHNGKYHGDDWWFEHISIDNQNRKIARMSPRNKQFWTKSDGTRNKKKSYAEQAVLRIQKELRDEGRTPIHHDDVISRLTFGFWVALLGKDFEDVTTKSLLWPNLLSAAFPNTSGVPKRHKIDASLNRVRALRNRLSHHEPIWKFYHLDKAGDPIYTKPVYGLNASLNLLNNSYEEILSVIKWMSPDRYQSFIDGKLDIEFRKLCSRDGFYGFVDPSKVETQAKSSMAKWELFRYLNSAQQGYVANIKRKCGTNLTIGINTPEI